MWFATRMTPPSRGTCSAPVQVRWVNTFAVGLTTNTATRRQNPSLTVPPRRPQASSHHAWPGRRRASAARHHGRIPHVRASGWVAVVPVKRLPLAKTRLRGALPGVPHERLVVAMALDTVTAVLACPRVRRVLVVTDDAVAGPLLGALGAECVPHEPAGGLNPALTYGARHSASTERVVALTADLPALRVAELSAALRAAERVPGRCYVPDAAGTGTVLLAAPGGEDLGPRFGPGSAA